MQLADWTKIEEIFNQAVFLTPAKRDLLVKSLCDEDGTLYAEVIALLRADSESRNFFEKSQLSLIRHLFRSDTSLSSPTMFGPYELKSVLGTGDRGVVFLAEALDLAKPVVLNILPRITVNAAQAAESFKSHHIRRSEINHPNVAHVYGFSRHDGHYFCTMEHVTGSSLRALSDRSDLSLPFVLGVILQVARGVQAFHDHGDIYGDLRPESIVVDDRIPETGVPSVKLLGFNLDDFGSSRISPSVYIAPERLRGQPPDVQTDIWSIGVILYELLAGEPPFGGKNAADLVTAIKLHDLPSLPVFNRVPSIQLALNRALSRNKRERYASVGEFIKDLRNAGTESDALTCKDLRLRNIK